ncbi:N-acetylmuramoyl-L-alanine amidase [Fictibacillus gelatini]|uniref:N-acetylmuramoyl-L-alanine amidase n=1 Tax=Fictibacillus gelatini TaxID=225985 RepID=UPI000426651C|nr:N-acetylmuramoyl-L-alanine amidase [Fictibacillus gelatini]
MSKIVVIDPGHGGKDSGCVGNGLKEKDIVLKISKYTRDELIRGYEDVTVYLTREDDRFIELSDRARFANGKKADLFISNHVNAGGGTGFESFVYKTIGAGSSTEKYRRIVHDEVLAVYKKHGFGEHGTGLKKENFAVVRETSMPAMLLEHLFIDSKDAKFLKDDDNLKEVAAAEAKGIARALGLKPKTKVDTEPKTTVEKKKDGELYRVQVGAFKDKKNADSLAKELEKKGYKPFVR